MELTFHHFSKTRFAPFPDRKGLSSKSFGRIQISNHQFIEDTLSVLLEDLECLIDILYNVQ